MTFVKLLVRYELRTVFYPFYIQNRHRNTVGGSRGQLALKQSANVTARLHFALEPIRITRNTDFTTS